MAPPRIYLLPIFLLPAHLAGVSQFFPLSPLLWFFWLALEICPLGGRVTQNGAGHSLEPGDPSALSVRRHSLSPNHLAELATLGLYLRDYGE